MLNILLNFLVKPLSCQVDRWVNEWNKTCIERKRVRYSALEQLLRGGGVAPLFFVGLIGAVSVFFSWVFYWIGPKSFGMCPIPAGWSEAEFLSYFSTLWSLQGAVVALVYPIVIAFVAVLLQRRATAKLSLRIYTIEAAVIPAGLSALALLGWMGVQYLFIPYIPNVWLASCMIGNSVWFVLNVILTGWFLFRTVSFLDDDQRFRIYKRFAVQVAFPREIRIRLLGLIFSNAQKNKLVPGEEYASEGSAPKVSLYPLGRGEACVKVRCDVDRSVVDVRLRLLSFGVSLWIWRTLKVAKTLASANRGERDPLLEIPIVPGEEVEGEVVLCRVENAPPPGSLASFLIKKSIVFGPPPRLSISFTTSEILEELGAETVALAEQRKFAIARQTLIDIADIHIALIKSGAFADENGKLDNAALLDEAYNFGSRKIHECWLGIYRQITEKAVNDLAVDTSLYRRLCYLAHRIVAHSREQHIDILLYTLNLPSHIMYRLGNWWVNKAEERGLEKHGPDNCIELPLPLRNEYDNALQAFVEGWEALRLYRGETLTGPDIAWTSYSRCALFTASIAEHTVRMLLGAVNRGDKAASLWLADSFLKWRNTHYHNFERLDLYGQHDYTLTFADIEKEWSTIRGLLDAVPDGQQEISYAGEVVSRLLASYWNNLRLILILILFDWTSADATEDDFLIELIASLIKGESLKEGGNVDAESFDRVETVCLLFFQILWLDSSYENKFDRIVDHAYGLSRTEMISGRVYGSDHKDARSLSAVLVQLLVALSSAEVKAPQKIVTVLNGWATDLSKLQNFNRRFQELSNYVDSTDFEKRILALRRVLQRSEDIGDAQAWVKAGCESLANIAAETHDTTLEEAEVSRERLNELEATISKFILGARNNWFPFSQIDTFEKVTNAGPSRRFVLRGVSKAQYSEPLLEREDLSTDNMFMKYVAEAVAGGVVNQYLETLQPKPMKLDSEVNYFSDFVERADSMIKGGQLPLVILSKFKKPGWLETWYIRSGDTVSGDFCSVRFPDNRNDPSLIAYFNEIPIYEVPIASGCYILPRNHFTEILYSEASEESCVRVSHVSEDNHKLSLTCEWMFGIKDDNQAG